MLLELLTSSKGSSCGGVVPNSTHDTIGRSSRARPSLWMVQASCCARRAMLPCSFVEIWPLWPIRATMANLLKSPFASLRSNTVLLSHCHFQHWTHWHRSSRSTFLQLSDTIWRVSHAQSSSTVSCSNRQASLAATATMAPAAPLSAAKALEHSSYANTSEIVVTHNQFDLKVHCPDKTRSQLQACNAPTTAAGMYTFPGRVCSAAGAI